MLAVGATVPGEASAKPIGPDPIPFSTQTTRIVHVTVPAGGFDWADAGIGAAGGLAVSILGIGAALTVSQRRTGHPHHRPARTS